MKNNGFTLIELLLVIGLLSVLAGAMNYDVMNVLDRNQVDVVGKQIAMDIRFAQQKAIEESRNWVMDFTDGTSLDLYKLYPEGESTKPRSQILISGNNVWWGDNLDAYKPVNLVFNPSGGITATANIFAISNKEEDQMYIKVDIVTGRVTLQATSNP